MRVFPSGLRVAASTFAISEAIDDNDGGDGGDRTGKGQDALPPLQTAQGLSSIEVVIRATFKRKVV
jgi:hypothetical protein